jgi:hypothetical protein
MECGRLPENRSRVNCIHAKSRNTLSRLHQDVIEWKRFAGILFCGILLTVFWGPQYSIANTECLVSLGGAGEGNGDYPITLDD